MPKLMRSCEMEDILEPYLDIDRRSPTTGRPWILANMVMSLDGSVTIEGRVGKLSGDVDAETFASMRTLADVILVGAQTVRRERYGPVRLTAERIEQRRDRGRTSLPTFAVVSRSLDFNFPDLPLFEPSSTTPRPIILTCASADRGRRDIARQHADVLTAGDDNVDLRAAMNLLAERGHAVVLCEGGPSTLGEVLELDLLDELCLSVAPIIGGDHNGLTGGTGTFLRSVALQSTVVTDDGTLLLRYTRMNT